MAKTVWRCEPIHGEEVMNPVVFDSEEQATRFVTRTRLVQLDVNVTWRLERLEEKI